MTNGIDCSIVGSDDLVAGSASRENWLIDGRALLSDASAGLPTLSTLSSAGIAARRFWSCDANAANVVFRFVTRSPSDCSSNRP